MILSFVNQLVWEKKEPLTRTLPFSVLFVQTYFIGAVKEISCIFIYFAIMKFRVTIILSRPAGLEK